MLTMLTMFWHGHLCESGQDLLRVWLDNAYKKGDKIKAFIENNAASQFVQKLEITPDAIVATLVVPRTCDSFQTDADAVARHTRSAWNGDVTDALSAAATAFCLQRYERLRTHDPRANAPRTE